VENKNIIYFANDLRADHKVSSHHIAEELSKCNRILYVETGGMRKPRKSKRDMKRIFSRLFLWFKGVRKVSDNLYIYSLIIFPFYGRLFRKLNICLNVFVLRRAIKKYGFTMPILWFVAPHVSYLADYIKTNLIVYYCTDNVSEMPEVDNYAVGRLEDSLLEKANIVFATSEYLCNRLKEKNRNQNISYSPHAVDYKHFCSARDENLTVAAEVRNLKKPVIGYVGLIEKWIDLDLIGHIARLRPDWSVVLIGRVAVPANNIDNYANVKILGTKSYEDLPSYMKGFDVCISPFKINELTRSVNPIKIKEYLSTGRPVVATRIPEMEKFKDVVEIADTYDEFVEKIENIHKSDNGENIKKRMEFVKNDDWCSRVEDISKKIVNLMLNQGILGD